MRTLTGSQIIIVAKSYRKGKNCNNTPAMGKYRNKTVRYLAEHMVQKEEICLIMDMRVSTLKKREHCS